MGAIVWDYQGRFVAGACSMISHVPSASMAEALAIREGLNLIKRLGCCRVQAESDSLETIGACNGEERWWNEASTIFADCVDLVTHIGTVEFKHCPRDANRVPHELARFSFVNNISCNWDDDSLALLVRNSLAM
jgi:ribonuclease HI